MMSETINNIDILKRLGWTMKEITPPRTDGVNSFFDTKWTPPNQAPDKHTWIIPPDYVNDLNHAITLTVPGKALTLQHYPADEESAVDEWEAFYANAKWDGKEIESYYAEIPSQVICLAWLAEMEALDESG